MLLKALVQLFAEKFLQRKRAWIQHAVGPSVEAIHFSITKDNVWHTLTSSADGYVTFSGNASSVILALSASCFHLTTPPLNPRGFLLGVRIELWSAPNMVLILEADTIVDNVRSRCIEAYRVSQNAERKPL